MLSLSVEYDAACPECSKLVLWIVQAESNGDLTRTSFDYNVQCEDCFPAATLLRLADEAETNQAWLRRF